MQLTIAEESSPAPSPPDVSDPSATVWRDGEDAIVALGQTVADRHWVHVPGLGAFSFGTDRDEIVALPDAGADPRLIEDTYRRTVLPLALQALGREVLHASAVKVPAGVIALCAVSGTGKSTLACALSRRGHELWADDAVCFGLREEAVWVEALPFTLRLRPASAAYFAADPAEQDVQRPVGGEPLARIFVLGRTESGGPRMERLSAADAFRDVLTHGYCFDLRDKRRKEAMMRNYLELVDRVPVFRVTFPEGLDHLDDTLDLIASAG